MSAEIPQDTYRSVLEHIVDDLLELSYAVAKDSRDCLCEWLRVRRICAESVQTHPSFTIDRMVIVIRDESEIEECWFFDPKLKRFKKMVSRN